MAGPKNKLPPELHLVQGTKGMNQGKLLPDDIKNRIPKAYWLENPKLWDEDKFIADTSEFLFKVYGIGADQYQHTLAMLADHITTYVQCRKGLQNSHLIVQYNDGKTMGPNPLLNLRDKVTPRIITLMNELGLTPRGRLAGTATDDVELGHLMHGPEHYNK
jgi:phage terminase small subunit